MDDHPAPAGPHSLGGSFEAGRFDPVRLAAQRRAHGTTVSVVVPAVDEAGTVGEVVAGLRRAGMGRADLIDELVVIDGGSTDGTPAAAEAAGARVLAQAEVLPAAGDTPGKGEALWKGLAATTGELVVFVDADVTDLDGPVLAGLLGPLLDHEEIAFVKAAYRRPLELGGQRHPDQGGRVTELMARPLIGAFWPQLAGLAQPLAGEYAGRRGVLERLPFVQGWGVELALLIDLLGEVGPEAIAQSDLGTRSHHHQDLRELGRMATELLHVALDRLEAAGRLKTAGELAARLVQPVRGDGGWRTVSHPVEVRQRPPLADWRD